MQPTLADRRLALEGVENFRDFGGYPTVDGRHLRRGRPRPRTELPGRARPGTAPVQSRVRRLAIVAVDR